MKHLKLAGAIAIGASFFSVVALADINRVRVVNDSNTTIYIHVGGYAPSSRIEPGQWKIFYYPFVAYPPGEKGTSVKTSKLVATAGGRWLTTPNGYTYLSKPQMVICLDYQSDEHKHKTGNRVWTINHAYGFDKDCQVQGYKQPWSKN